MGRYFFTDNGREGKFMFGVQPSDDPQYMGMTEDNSHIQYYASEDDVPEITRRLDEQYDILGVPKEERLYTYKNYDEYDKYENEVLKEKVWTTVKEDDKEAMKEHEKEARWASDKEGYVMFERSKDMCLALARIRLATTVLSDIKDSGYCSLDAEV